MLSLSSIVTVLVNARSASSSGTAFSTGLILAPAAGASVTDAQRLRLFASAADMLADPSGDFTASSPAYLAAKAYFEANPAPDRVYVSLYPSNEALADALDAVLDLTADFYAVYAAETGAAKILALAEHMDALGIHGMLFCAATGSVSDATAAGSMARTLYELGTDRACVIYGADTYAAPALMGSAMGLARVSGGAPFSLCYKAVGGMTPTDLTESEIASLQALNCNVYVTRGLTRKLLEKGSVASGMRFDEVYFVDRIAAGLQEAALSLMTESSARLPQTDETSALFINRFSSILAAYSASAVLATAPWRGGAVGRLQPGDTVEGGYLLWADSYDMQSDADRQAHKAMPIHAALCLAGSVESLVINIDVTT